MKNKTDKYEHLSEEEYAEKIMSMSNYEMFKYWGELDIVLYSKEEIQELLLNKLKSFDDIRRWLLVYHKLVLTEGNKNER